MVFKNDTAPCYSILDLSLYWEIPVHRIALGGEMRASGSRMTDPYPGCDDPNSNILTGKIGFLDYIIKFLEPRNNEDPRISDPPWVDSLIIKAMGIEPEYRKQGNAKFLVEIAEKIAREQNLAAVVAERPNEDAESMLAHLGYDTNSRNPFKMLQRS